MKQVNTHWASGKKRFNTEKTAIVPTNQSILVIPIGSLGGEREKRGEGERCKEV